MQKKLAIVFYAAIGAAALADWLVPERDHPAFWWHYAPVFDLAFGLVACLLIIKGSKFLAKHALERPEDYYD